MYVDVVGGGLHVVGEIRNNSPSNQGFLRVTITLRQGGQVVHTAQGFALLSTLRPTERSPFDVSLGTPPNFDDYVVAVSGQATLNDPIDQFTILSQSTFTDTLHNFWVVGELRNDLNSNAAFVLTVGTFYDPDGRVWRAGQGYTLMRKLTPGQRSPFRLSVRGDYDDITTYVLKNRGLANVSPPR
jgi:hypothetical protein